MLGFLEYVQSLNDVEIKSIKTIHPNTNYHRIVVTAPLENDLWGGFLVTVKNVKKFLKSRQTNNGFKISTSDIESDENLIDVNFFIFNPQNGAGLYQYYHSSAYLNTLNSAFADKFKEYALINGFKGRLSHTGYLTSVDMKGQISQLAAVHHVEYELSSLAIPSQSAVPASGMVARQRIKVFYDRKLYGSQLLRDGIQAFLSDKVDDIKRFFVKGQNNVGDDVRLDYCPELSVLSQSEHADFTVELDVNEGVADLLKTNDNLSQLVQISKYIQVKTFFYSEVAP